MAEVNEECTFCTIADQVRLETMTNGDRVRIDNLMLTQDQVTSLAWLINADGSAELEFQIKIKGT